MVVCSSCHKWISDEKTRYRFGSLTTICGNCMKCVFCGAYPKWWVGGTGGLLTCEKCYEDKGIKEMPRDKFEELVAKVNAEREAAEEAKLIVKRAYPATDHILEKFQQETGSLSPEYLAQLLEAIAADCDDEARKLAGGPFSRTESSLHLAWENAYDSTDPAQKNPELYGSDYDHVRKWRHIDLEVMGTGGNGVAGNVKPNFDAVRVSVRSRVQYDIVKRKEIGIEFKGGTRDIAFTKHTGGSEESDKILLDETIIPSQIRALDDTISKALHRFKTEVDWFWFNG